MYKLQEECLRVVAGCLLALCVVLVGSCVAAGQETEQSDVPDDIILDLSEDEPVREESPTRKREMLYLPPVPFLTDEGKDAEGDKDSREPPAQAAASESELWQTVLQLKSDLEMLKEEIAQLRSEFRALMPKEAEEEGTTKRTVNPFWITDAQLGQRGRD